MQALQLTEWQHEPELREIDPPEPGPGEVVQRYTLGTAPDAYRAMQDGTLEGRAVIVHEA